MAILLIMCRVLNLTRIMLKLLVGMRTSFVTKIEIIFKDEENTKDLNYAILSLSQLTNVRTKYSASKNWIIH